MLWAEILELFDCQVGPDLSGPAKMLQAIRLVAIYRHERRERLERENGTQER
jgi:hypothetical protein